MTSTPEGVNAPGAPGIWWSGVIASPLTIVTADGTTILEWNAPDEVKVALCSRELIEKFVAEHNELIALRAEHARPELIVASEN